MAGCRAAFLLYKLFLINKRHGSRWLHPLPLPDNSFILIVNDLTWLFKCVFEEEEILFSSVWIFFIHDTLVYSLSSRHKSFEIRRSIELKAPLYSL